VPDVVKPGIIAMSRIVLQFVNEHWSPVTGIWKLKYKSGNYPAFSDQAKFQIYNQRMGDLAEK